MAHKTRLTVNDIVKAAAEIANAQGLNQVTLAVVAKKLNITSPSLYSHIDGLQQLREMLAIYSMEQLYNQLLHASVGKAGDDAVHALGDAYIAFVRNQPGLYDATFFSVDANDDEVYRAANRITELVVRVLGAYGLKEEAALHVTRGLRSIFHGFSSLEQKGGFGLPLDKDVSYRLLIDTYLAGLKNPTMS